MIGRAMSHTVEPPNALEWLIGNTLAPTPIVKDLQYLTNVIGGRPTGSVALNNAMQWSLQRFKDAGYSQAYLDEYTAVRNWLPNVEIGEISYAKIGKDSTLSRIRVAAMPFSPSTPADGLQGQIYAMTTTDVNEIKTHKKEIKGHWLLVKTTPMHTMDDLLKEYLDTPPVFKAAKQAGAIGILWLSNRSGRLLYRHDATMNSDLAPFPAALIEREGGERIAQLIQAGETVSFKAILTNIVQEKPKNYNVVAEIKGSEKPNEVIVLGAHLDSWDLGQGALDNGCNATMVMDVARQIMILKQKGFQPKRTIRFILYSGEEIGMYGSSFDAKKSSANQTEITKAVIIYDIGSGRTTGFSLGGRKEMVALVNHALQPIEILGPFTQTTDAFIGTDNFDYLLQGIPTIVANQDATPYLPDYHAESDTFNKVDERELKFNSVIASVLTWNLANTEDAIPGHQSFTEVTQLLEATGVKKQMEIFDLWEDFITQKRYALNT